MTKEKTLKTYKLSIAGIITAGVLYLLVAIGDLIIKGYSNLSVAPFVLCAVLTGVMLGLYFKEKNKK